jgi:hypothetical protein
MTRSARVPILPAQADDQTRYPAAIMRLLYYPARTIEEARELEPGIGVRPGSPDRSELS